MTSKPKSNSSTSASNSPSPGSSAYAKNSKPRSPPASTATRPSASSSTRKLAKADTERRKLLDAYYANAIDVTTLKAEQARIATDVRSAEERLAAVDAHLAEWQEILETAMRFATNCAKAYARASAPTRRRFNQAVFTRIDVRDGKIAAVGYHPPFDLLFSTSEFEYGDLVETMGLEPTTPCLQSRCSSS